MNKKALIFGITGQDGILMSKYLLNKGYSVFGTFHNSSNENILKLKKYSKIDENCIYKIDVINQHEVTSLINNINPCEIYNFAGITSVADSFNEPKLTFQTNFIGTLNILETLKTNKRELKFFNAGSGDCFGELQHGNMANEETKFNPKSPYAISKASSYYLVKNYRESYNIKCCTGILFNHESQFRSEKFVTKKIVATAHRISNGSKEKLKLGNIQIYRDWGWAEEYIKVMHQMLQIDRQEDMVISTGSSHSLEEFVEYCFELFDLNYKDHIEINNQLIRPTDIGYTCGNSNKAYKKLGWKSETDFYSMIEKMKNIEIQNIL